MWLLKNCSPEKSSTAGRDVLYGGTMTLLLILECCQMDNMQSVFRGWGREGGGGGCVSFVSQLSNMVWNWNLTFDKWCVFHRLESNFWCINEWIEVSNRRGFDLEIFLINFCSREAKFHFNTKRASGNTTTSFICIWSKSVKTTLNIFEFTCGCFNFFYYNNPGDALLVYWF